MLHFVIGMIMHGYNMVEHSTTGTNDCTGTNYCKALIKIHGNESQGEEEATCTRVFWPM